MGTNITADSWCACRSIHSLLHWVFFIYRRVPDMSDQRSRMLIDVEAQPMFCSPQNLGVMQCVSHILAALQMWKSIILAPSWAAEKVTNVSFLCASFHELRYSRIVHSIWKTVKRCRRDSGKPLFPIFPFSIWQIDITKTCWAWCLSGSLVVVWAWVYLKIWNTCTPHLTCLPSETCLSWNCGPQSCSPELVSSHTISLSVSFSLCSCFSFLWFFTLFIMIYMWYQFPHIVRRLFTHTHITHSHPPMPALFRQGSPRLR